MQYKDSKYTNLNLHPNLLAATFATQNSWLNKSIAVRPDDKNLPAQLTEITRTVENEKNNTLTIFTKTQSKERQELINELDGNCPFQYLLEPMETVIGQFKTAVCLEERQHILGTSELHTRFSEWPDFLDMDQRKIMSYYLPWLTHIQGDLELTASCFQSAVGYPVSIHKCNPKKVNIKGATVGHWVLGHEDVAGGRRVKATDCVCIEIGPVPLGEVHVLVEGSRQRRFLEEVLFPKFLPEAWDWDVKIQVQEDIGKKVAESYNDLRFVGTTSYIS